MTESPCEHVWLGKTVSREIIEGEATIQVRLTIVDECIKCLALRDMSGDKFGIDIPADERDAGQ